MLDPEARFTRVNRWLLAIIGLSVGLRVAAALYLGNTVAVQPGTADQLSYHALALRVLDGHGFSFGTGWWPATPAGEPTAHWSFLYVLFLAATYAIAEFVKFWPSTDSDRVSNAARVMSSGLCAPFLVAGVVIGLRAGRHRVDQAERWLLVGIALAYSLTHLLTWTLVRYRLPVDALLLPFAALSVVHLSDWLVRAARTVRTDLVVTG